MTNAAPVNGRSRFFVNETCYPRLRPHTLSPSHRCMEKERKERQLTPLDLFPEAIQYQMQEKDFTRISLHFTQLLSLQSFFK